MRLTKLESLALATAAFAAAAGFTCLPLATLGGGPGPIFALVALGTLILAAASALVGIASVLLHSVQVLGLVGALGITGDPLDTLPSLVVLSAAVMGGVVWTSAVSTYLLPLGAPRVAYQAAPREFESIAGAATGLPSEGALTFHIANISLPQHQATGLLVLDFKNDFLNSKFEDAATGATVSEEQLMNDPRYENLVVHLAVGTESSASGQTFDFPISRIQPEPASMDASPGFSYVPLGNFSVAILGDSRSYPTDAYDAYVVAVAKLPDQLRVRWFGSLIQTLPLLVHVTDDLDLVGFDVSYYYGDPPIDEPNLAILRIARAGDTQAFVMSVGLLPIALVALIAHAARSPDTKPETAITVLVGALFTVLPLRAVLVPADVGGITLVDHMLGSEMVLIVLVAAGVYWIQTTGRRLLGAQSAALSRRGPTH